MAGFVGSLSCTSALACITLRLAQNRNLACLPLMASYRPGTLLSNSFAFYTPVLFFARARLYADRLELTGWSLRGRYRHTLAIDQVLQVDMLDKRGLLLWLSTGETLRLRIREAARWKAAIEVQVNLCIAKQR